MVQYIVKSVSQIGVPHKYVQKIRKYFFLFGNIYISKFGFVDFIKN